MNQDFLRAIFGGQADRAHVTSFPDDPSSITPARRGACWAGRRYNNKPLAAGNQYFTISLFHDDTDGAPRRRKALFQSCHVVTLDDVKEKLDLVAVQALPPPSYILETSPGSEQWGYILTAPATDRARVENLQEGLIKRGLAPDGKDPGMRGVTRYVRLPDGVNTKQSKMLFGMPWACRLVEWHPERRVTLEQLAAPFGVDLDAARHEGHADAAELPDHPLLHTTLAIKAELSPGRYSVTCPWVAEHTGAEDDGAAVFTNADGSIGFKCHHGSCQERTGRDLMNALEAESPGIKRQLSEYIAMTGFKGIAPTAPPAPTVSSAPPLQAAMDQLKRLAPGSTEANACVETILKAARSLTRIEQLPIEEEIRHICMWSKRDFQSVLGDLNKKWATRVTGDFSEFVFVREQNGFWSYRLRKVLPVEAFVNGYKDQDAELRENALQRGLIDKVDRLDYAPGLGARFVENEVKYANQYVPYDRPGTRGDAHVWLDHWRHIGWADYQEHMLRWMAFTVQHPETKINHMMILGGKEGIGKDFLLTPLLAAMGHNGRVVDGSELIGTNNGYLLGCKYLHINEVDTGNHKDAGVVSNKLKPLAAAPPDTLRVNEKYVRPYSVRNVVNGTMGTNSKFPIRVQGTRRFFAAWSDLDIRGPDGNRLPEWNEYWADAWAWMATHIDACIWFLRNEVDISGFNPGEPPPVTDWLREIEDMSTPPLERTLRELIRNEIGVFAQNVISTEQIRVALAFGDMQAADYMAGDFRAVGAVAICAAMKALGFQQRRTSNETGTRQRVWIIHKEKWLWTMPVGDFTAICEKVLTSAEG